MADIGKIEELANKRKEKLKALKSKQKDGGGGPPEKKLAGDSEALPRPIFRSYKPHDETLKEARLPQVKVPEVTEQVKEQLEASEPKPLVDEIDLANLAPRKPDWDLKRDVAKKLEKLERRTQRAIAELIRERLMEGQENLAAAVDAAAAQTAEDED